MVELVDTLALGASLLLEVRVRVSPAALSLSLDLVPILIRTFNVYN